MGRGGGEGRGEGGAGVGPIGTKRAGGRASGGGERREDAPGRGEGGDLKHVDVNLALEALLLGGDAPADAAGAAAAAAEAAGGDERQERALIRRGDMLDDEPEAVLLVEDRFVDETPWCRRLPKATLEGARRDGWRNELHGFLSQAHYLVGPPQRPAVAAVAHAHVGGPLLVRRRAC